MTTHKIKLLSEIIVDKSVYHQLTVEKDTIIPFNLCVVADHHGCLMTRVGKRVLKRVML